MTQEMSAISGSFSNRIVKISLDISPTMCFNVALWKYQKRSPLRHGIFDVSALQKGFLYLQGKRRLKPYLREGGDLYIFLLMQFESFCNLGKDFADTWRNSNGSQSIGEN